MKKFLWRKIFEQLPKAIKQIHSTIVSKVAFNRNRKLHDSFVRDHDIETTIKTVGIIKLDRLLMKVYGMAGILLKNNISGLLMGSAWNHFRDCWGYIYTIQANLLGFMKKKSGLNNTLRACSNGASKSVFRTGVHTEFNRENIAIVYVSSRKYFIQCETSKQYCYSIYPS